MTRRRTETRGVEFYPSALEKGIRGERALKLAVAAMYVQGVSSRKVAAITEPLRGPEVTDSQVSPGPHRPLTASSRNDDPAGATPYLSLDAERARPPRRPRSLVCRPGRQSTLSYLRDSSYGQRRKRLRQSQRHCAASVGSTNGTSLGVNVYRNWACDHEFFLLLGLDSRGLHLKPFVFRLVY